MYSTSTHVQVCLIRSSHMRFISTLVEVIYLLVRLDKAQQGEYPPTQGNDVNPLRQRSSRRPYSVRLRLFPADYVILLSIGQCPPSELQSDLHLVLFLSSHRTLTPAFLDEQPFTTTPPPMSTSALLRLATRAYSPSATLLRSPISCSAVPRRLWAPVAGGGHGSAHTFSTTVRRRSGEHGEESFEEFTARYGLPSHQEEKQTARLFRPSSNLLPYPVVGESIG